MDAKTYLEKVSNTTFNNRTILYDLEAKDMIKWLEDYASQVLSDTLDKVTEEDIRRASVLEENYPEDTAYFDAGSKWLLNHLKSLKQ